jgi:hypothetical protein
MIKISSKIISCVVGVGAVGVISVTAATTIPTIQSSASSVNINSSTVSRSINSILMSSSNNASASIVTSSFDTVSSKEVKNVDDGVTAIQKATDEGISKIKQTTSEALKQIQDNTTSSSKIIKHTFSTSGSITVSKEITVKYLRDKTKTMIGTTNIAIDNNMYSFSDDESNQFVTFNYYCTGNIPSLESVNGLKAEGFTITNTSGSSLDFICDNPKSNMEFKVKYTNISDISTMYLNYKDQRITIKVS